MAKILLVEDDNNLREIYEARLQAEGYDIVSARDGEEALTVAMKERPDLIISDVMMPKISGFDMLDIIRSTPETKDVKVIMMTALSQAEDKARAEKLGADRYLVKSQVTLEDVAKVAREVLNGESAGESTPATEPVSSTPAPAPEAATPAPVVDTPTPVPAPATTPAVVDSTADDTAGSGSNPALAAVAPATDDNTPDPAVAAQTTDTEQDAIAAQIESFIDSKKNEAEAVVEAPTEVKEEVAEKVETETPTTPAENKDDASAAVPSGKKVIQPISDPTESKEASLNVLLEKEKEKEQMAEIAKTFSADKSGVADELSAEAALRSAARNASESEAVEESSDSEVKITEDGDLKVQSAPIEAPAEEITTPPIDTSDVPSVAQPSSTGTNIDGVVPNAATPAPAKPAGADHDLISL